MSTINELFTNMSEEDKAAMVNFINEQIDDGVNKVLASTPTASASAPVANPAPVSKSASQPKVGPIKMIRSICSVATVTVDTLSAAIVKAGQQGITELDAAIALRQHEMVKELMEEGLTKERIVENRNFLNNLFS